MPGTIVKSGAKVEYAIVGENCVVESGARIGVSPEQVENRDDWGIAVVGHNVTISGNAVVKPKDIISENM
jgi:glucose-1-phosphate adenylyltransferase